MLKRKHQFREDYVTSLLTGKFDSVKTKDGGIKIIFVPSKRNEYQPISELVTSRPNSSRQQILEEEGMIYPPLQKKEADKRTLQEKEKEFLEKKKARKAYKELCKPENKQKFLFQQKEFLSAIRNFGIPNWGDSSFTTVIQ